MEKIDLEIAKRLSKNARTPFSHIAKQLNLFTAYVIERYKKLKESGFFIRSSITVDMEKLGYPANTMILIKTVGPKIMGIHKRILEIPNVIVLTKIIGEWDLLAIIPLASFKDLFEIEKQLGAISGIEKFQIKINPQFPKWPINFSIPLDCALSNNV